MLLGHGGNIKEVADRYEIPENRIIDFSSNINPLGFPLKIKDIITKRIQLINQYPDTESKSARQAVSNYLGIDKNNILLGNGSNEFIHLLPRALDCSRALIYQPAFSEYELSIRLSGAKSKFVVSQEKDNFCIDTKKIVRFVPKVNLIILCNPNNPTGYLIKKAELLNLTLACEKNKTYLLVDEAFIEFVEEGQRYSLVKEVLKYRHLLVLRSLTKFFALPGLRIGYLVAACDLIRKISLFQPTWSVNNLAQGVVAGCLSDSNFIQKTKDSIKKEGDFLFNGLKAIKEIQPYYPTANFIFCKVIDKKLDARVLSLRLIKYRIVIRDCSNFKGLDRRFFRIAVRKRDDNLYFIGALRRIFK